MAVLRLNMRDTGNKAGELTSKWMRRFLNLATSNRHCKGPITSENKVFIVGAGPGDPDLLTVMAVKAIQSADVILFDWLVDERILTLAPERAQLVFVGKRNGRHSVPQEEICRLLVQFAKTGKTVVRLKGGDPSLFARTVEETQALEASGVRYAIIPGITAASGAAAFTGIPLTERHCAGAVKLMTGRFKEANKQMNWDQLAEQLLSETAVIYMGLQRLPILTRALKQRGVSQSLPISLIEHATGLQQKVIVGTLDTIDDTISGVIFDGPVLIVIGHVIKHRQSVDLTLLSELSDVVAV